MQLTYFPIREAAAINLFSASRTSHYSFAIRKCTRVYESEINAKEFVFYRSDNLCASRSAMFILHNQTPGHIDQRDIVYFLLQLPTIVHKIRSQRVQLASLRYCSGSDERKGQIKMHAHHQRHHNYWPRYCDDEHFGHERATFRAAATSTMSTTIM